MILLLLESFIANQSYIFFFHFIQKCRYFPLIICMSFDEPLNIKTFVVKRLVANIFYELK